MVLCYTFTQKSPNELETSFAREISDMSVDKMGESTEIIIPAKILDFAKNTLESRNIVYSVVNKSVFKKTFLEDGPEDIYPPIQYEYERECINYNGKILKLNSLSCDSEQTFRQKYVVLWISLVAKSDSEYDKLVKASIAKLIKHNK